MTYCLNPACKHPDNLPTNIYCHGCGLLLANSSHSYLFHLHYKIIKKLGEGSFGRTYLAEDLDLKNEPRVIKKLIATGTGTNLGKIKELFEREADRLYDLNHPQIPKLYAYFEENNYLYLVQEYIQGQDLFSEWQQQGNFSEAKIEQGLRELLPILEYIHHHKVLHRDIKPENIMRRSSDGKLVLIDFGSAKQTTETLQSGPGTRLYTPGYAAREHMRGRPKAASDIYSLGVTMVRLLTGVFADFDEYSNMDDPLYDEDNGQWLWRDYAQKREIKVSSHLANVLDKMIEDLAKNRYQSATEVLKALNSASQPQVKQQPSSPRKPLAKTTQITPRESSIQLKTLRKPNRSTLPIRNFLKWIGLGDVGKDDIQQQQNIHLSLNETAQPQVKPPQTPPTLPLGKQRGKITQTSPSVTETFWKTFSFEVVTVNSRGKITNRESKSAKYFTAELGNEVTMDFVYIPGGKFLMGSPRSEKQHYDSESPQHWVTVPEFFMGKYQVTQAQWQAVMGNNPSYFKGENRPVENVSWYDCVEFCKKLSPIIGRECRLPTEAEWEYACRAGTTTPFYFGETITSDLANYYGNYTYANESQGVYREETTPVGQFPPNAFGLYDMHGNVWEWCLDSWHDNYQKAPTDGRAWRENDNDSYIIRGGSWDIFAFICRSAYRMSYDPVARVSNSGFRVVRG